MPMPSKIETASETMVEVATDLPTTEVILLTPSLAQKLLDNQRKNRLIRESHVDKFVRCIQRNEFNTTHQGIAVDSDGRLCDGQHRCRAVVDSGITVKIMKSTLFSESSIAAIDRGRGRSQADILTLGGEIDASRIASTVKRLWYYQNHPNKVWQSRFTPTDGEVQELLRENPLVRPAVRMVHHCNQVGGTADLSLCLFLFLKKSPVDAEKFKKAVATGANLVENSPILVLRNRLINSKGKRGTPLSSRERVAIIIKAWNFWRQGITIKSLRLGPKEKMPKPM
jgi:hypothetical protein